MQIRKLYNFIKMSNDTPSHLHPVEKKKRQNNFEIIEKPALFLSRCVVMKKIFNQKLLTIQAT